MTTHPQQQPKPSYCAGDGSTTQIKKCKAPPGTASDPTAVDEEDGFGSFSSTTRCLCCALIQDKHNCATSNTNTNPQNHQDRRVSSKQSKVPKITAIGSHTTFALSSFTEEVDTNNTTNTRICDGSKSSSSSSSSKLRRRLSCDKSTREQEGPRPGQQQQQPESSPYTGDHVVVMTSSCSSNDHNTHAGGGGGGTSAAAFSSSRLRLLLHQNQMRARWIIPCLILTIGTMASVAFVALGIATANHELQMDFSSQAAVYPDYFKDVLDQYNVAGMWAHCAVAHTDLTRERFRDVYEHIQATGLEFQALDYIPRVSQEERAQYELEAQTYYATHYPDFRYPGFTGKEPIPDDDQTESSGNNNSPLLWTNRSVQDFYFVQHYVEPFAGNEMCVDFDIYSSHSRRMSVETALATERPALSQVYGPEKNQMIMVHPGMPSANRSSNSTSDIPIKKVLTSILFELDDFMRRAVKFHNTKETIKVYLYDTSPDVEDNRTFLGGIAVNQCEWVSGDASVGEPNVIITKDCLLPAIPLHQAKNSGKWQYEEIFPAMSRHWTIVVTQDSTRSQSQFWYILSGGGVIFLACVCVAFWIHTNTAKVAKINRLKQKGAQERAQFMVDSANQAARAERELNDYVAHEVRNPLAAAISAHSFVHTELHANHPLSSKESQESVKEDLAIIGNSLHFINDLLRSMLDTSRASTNRMVIEKKPTDILSDVFEPIRSMLYLRDCTVDVLVECSQSDLIVMADCLRLKQVVFNLARNSSKFVQNGFIRLKAQVRDDTSTVQLSVEDSGPGVPVEKRGQLFSKFQSSLDSLSQGTGIGLSLSKKLVDLMGMELWLDEDFDSGIEGSPGARFVIETNMKCEHPDCGASISRDIEDYDRTGHKNTTENGLSSPPSILGKSGQANQQQQSAVTSMPEGLSVLFVDDDMILRKLFARTIRKVAPDWKIREASNGETALQLVENSETFDLIFMDQYMASVEQQMLGTEATRALRARGVSSIICGLSANNVETGFLEAGGDSFIFKPFPTEASALRNELIRVLQSAEHRVHLFQKHEQQQEQHALKIREQQEDQQKISTTTILPHEKSDEFNQQAEHEHS
ncbi:hypothetical protein ACA910_013949 [Epithemia clementina (nom. ined.)]